jgi:hypothetical protein
MKVPADVRARAFRKMAAALRQRAEAFGTISGPTKAEVATVRRRIADNIRASADELEIEADQLAPRQVTPAEYERSVRAIELLHAHGALERAFRNPQNPPPPRGEA